MGGGRETLGDPDLEPPEIPFTFSGGMELNTSRTDGENLADKWTHDKEKLSFYVRNRTELNKVDTENTDYLLGIFFINFFFLLSINLRMFACLRGALSHDDLIILEP